MVSSFESVSTWRQSAPAVVSPARAHLMAELAQDICSTGAKRIRVAIDGYTAAGKTTFGHELAAAIRHQGRPTARASLDDFKHPWSHSLEHGYDRVTGEGYYRNAYDFDSARDLLLIPAGAHGTGRVALCGHDPLTGTDHRGTLVQLPANAVLIVDSAFAFRPEYNSLWDYRVWLEVSPELALHRGIERDGPQEGLKEATKLHRDRYHVAEAIYLREAPARRLADTAVDNSDYDNPLRLHISSPDGA